MKVRKLPPAKRPHFAHKQSFAVVGKEYNFDRYSNESGAISRYQLTVERREGELESYVLNRLITTLDISVSRLHCSLETLEEI